VGQKALEAYMGQYLWGGYLVGADLAHIIITIIPSRQRWLILILPVGLDQTAQPIPQRIVAEQIAIQLVLVVKIMFGILE